MRILILLAGVAAVAGAAESTQPRPSSASRAWATKPSTPAAQPAEKAEAEKPAAEKPATPAATRDDTPAAALEPRVQTSAPAAPSATAPAAVTAPLVVPRNVEVASPAASPSPPRPVATTAATGTSGVRDRLELDTTQITGNRELPRVMYVVPWKRADLGDLAGRPVNSLLDEALAPVDRDVFRRQSRYYQALRPDTGN